MPNRKEEQGCEGSWKETTVSADSDFSDSILPNEEGTLRDTQNSRTISLLDWRSRQSEMDEFRID